MAKVSAPFLSLSAGGKFADTLVAARWKGIPYMRQYVVPANPKTTAQVAHRALFTASVLFWQTIKTDALMVTAWALEALVSPVTLSGFNSFMANVLGIVKTDADGSFVETYIDTAGVASFDMLNADDATTGDEAGDFEIWRGTTKTNLALIESKTIVAGTITATIVAADGTFYYRIMKGGFSRGGIMVLTQDVP